MGTHWNSIFRCDNMKVLIVLPALVASIACDAAADALYGGYGYRNIGPSALGCPYPCCQILCCCCQASCQSAACSALCCQTCSWSRSCCAACCSSCCQGCPCCCHPSSQSLCPPCEGYCLCSHQPVPCPG